MNKDIKKNDIKELENELVKLSDKVEQTENIALLEKLNISIQAERFEGPIPSPKHMESYKNIDKSFPDRILKMAEKNLNHKQDIEKINTKGELFIGFLGWLTPTVISGYVLYSAVGFIENGQSIEALIALTVSIATLATSFYVKNKTSKK